MVKDASHFSECRACRERGRKPSFFMVSLVAIKQIVSNCAKSVVIVRGL